MKLATYRLLLEALRRWVCFKEWDHETLLTAWTGLGTASTYKPAIDDGYMEWVHGSPLPRQILWLRLTPSGAKIVQHWLDTGITVKDYEVYNNPTHPPTKAEIAKILGEAA